MGVPDTALLASGADAEQRPATVVPTLVTSTDAEAAIAARLASKEKAAAKALSAREASDVLAKNGAKLRVLRKQLKARKAQ